MREVDWLLSSVIALLGWGLWGVFGKLASRYLDFYQIYIASGIVSLIAFPAVFLFFRPQIDVRSPGVGYSLLAGVAGTSAVIAFYSAMSGGKASIVVPFTALYPVVTILLSHLILGEQLSPLKVVGILCALLAIVCLSID